jgi:NADH dehydrogenase FAD-containing subunit
MPPTALILGGGVGGVVAANRLRRLLPHGDRIVVVDRHAESAFAASLPWVVAGRRRARTITRPRRRLLKPGVELVTGEIEQILPEAREVVVAGQRLAGDALVITLGAALAPERIPGLAAQGIGYFPAHQVTSVDPVARQLRFASGEEAPFDPLGFVPPHTAPDAVVRSGLAAEGGWIATDRQTLATRWPGVYALGDVVSIPLAMGKPLPKAGVFTRAQSEVVARNIAAVRLGRPAEARFDGHGMCFIEVGGGRAGIGQGNFYAEPVPEVALKPPGRWEHFGKVLFEQAWLRGLL